MRSKWAERCTHYQYFYNKKYSENSTQTILIFGIVLFLQNVEGRFDKLKKKLSCGLLKKIAGSTGQILYVRKIEQNIDHQSAFHLR